MEAIIIFPHQLFKQLPETDEDPIIYLVEHTRFFTDFTFHKQKLILHRASMKAYEKELKKKYKVVYVEFKQSQKLFVQLKKDRIKTVHYYDPVDHDLHKWIRSQAQTKKIELIEHETPMFLCDSELIAKEFKNKKSFLMHSFYVKQRKRLSILVRNGKPIGGKWSFDEQNREPMPKQLKVPSIPKARSNSHVAEAHKYVAKHFKNNPGETKHFIYPTTHAAAQTWLNDFLKKRFKQFGPYQDAITNKHDFLFHSLLSSSLNIGLLTPEYVIEKALSYAKKNKTPINSVEGFIRQIIGWREFVRGVYATVGAKQKKQNQLNNRKKVPQSFWNGTTNIAPVDDVIKKVLKTAYAHHIERLMILGNFMLLNNLSPHEVYAWFMELFIDAYDWVMVPNVYGMSQYADGGMIVTKPYVSGSGYILKMSDYKKSEWCDIWNALYWHFIAKHKKRFARINRMRMIMSLLRKMNKEKLNTHLKTAQKYLSV